MERDLNSSSSDLVEENIVLRDEISQLCHRVAVLEYENCRFQKEDDQKIGKVIVIEDCDEMGDIRDTSSFFSSRSKTKVECEDSFGRIQRLLLETPLKAELSAVSQKLEMYIVKYEQLELKSKECKKENDELRDTLNDLKIYNELLLSRATDQSTQVLCYQKENTGAIPNTTQTSKQG